MNFFIFILFRIDSPMDGLLRSAASDLGLHCLPMSQTWDARRICVNHLMPVLITR